MSSSDLRPRSQLQQSQKPHMALDVHNKLPQLRTATDARGAGVENGVDDFGTPSPRPRRISTIANPAPLGLFAFGMTTVCLMFVTTGWAESAALNYVLCLAMFYGGLVQAIAGLFELIKGNTFAATAFLSYGAFWMTFFLHNLTVKSAHAAAEAAGGGVPPAFTSAESFLVGETLIMALWGLFTAIFFVPTLRKNGCLMTVFGSLSVTFFLLAGGQWSGRCRQAAGYVGCFCGGSAIYTAAAEVWQESLGIDLPGLKPVHFI